MNENETGVRINKYLASCGLGSRRACDEMISAGRIYVNGVKVEQLGMKIIPGRDKVDHKGNEMTPIVGRRYLAYHKPRGIIVTKSDPEKRPTVFDVLKENKIDALGLNYVGRLDVNSEGLLLLTNDGDLIHRLTHPRYHIKKVYDVQINKKLSVDDSFAMKKGIESEGQILHAGDIFEIPSKDSFRYNIDLYEGKNRQIRRMFAALNYSILRLIRVQFGPVKLGEQSIDTFRELTFEELQSLQAAGFSPMEKKTHGGH